MTNDNPPLTTPRPRVTDSRSGYRLPTESTGIFVLEGRLIKARDTVPGWDGKQSVSRRDTSCGEEAVAFAADLIVSKVGWFVPPFQSGIDTHGARNTDRRVAR